MKFRKRPITIEAWQYVGQGCDEWPKWLFDYQGKNGALVGSFDNKELLIPTLEGFMTANIGDWVLQGVKGEIYPCKADIFEATYEAAE